MALKAGNPFKTTVPNINKRELVQKTEGLFRNWYTFGNKNDYMSAFPALNGVKPSTISKIDPIQVRDKGSGSTSYDITLTNSNEDDIIIATGAIVSSDQNFDFEFTNEDSDHLYGPIFGQGNDKQEISGENVLVPNLKNKDLIMNVTLGSSGRVFISLQGARVTLTSSASPSLNTGN